MNPSCHMKPLYSRNVSTRWVGKKIEGFLEKSLKNAFKDIVKQQ